MKILYLVSGIGPPAGWGTEFIQNLIFELSKKGVNATIINPIYKHTRPDWKTWTKDVEKRYKVRIVSLEAPVWVKERLLLHFALTPIFVTWAAIKLLRTQQFDLIHEFSSTPIILFRHFIFRLFGVRTIFTLSVYNNTILGKMLWFKIFNSANLYLIPSHEMVNKLVSFGLNKNKVIFCPPGINLTPFFKKIDKLSARKSLKLPIGKFIFSYFGSLTKEKGVTDIIEATKLIRKGIRQKILIVLFAVWKGSGQHQKIKDDIKSLHLPYLKLVEKYVDIPTLLAASDAVVLPLQTGHGTTIPPISVVETLATEKSLITTNIIGNRELFKDPNSLVVPRDPSSLARKIEIICSKKLEHRESVDLSIFNLSHTISTYYSIYFLGLAIKSQPSEI